MSRLQEMKDVLRNIRLAWNRNQKAAIVIQIGVKGSAYRLPGTKMMMASDGQMFGTISGGCLESDLYGWAEKAMEMNSPLTHKYDLSENEIWGLGIGCKGNLEMLILPVDRNDEFWVKTDQVVQKGQHFTLVLEIPTGNRLLVDKDGHFIGNHESVPLEVIEKAKTVMDTQTRAEIVACDGSRYLIDAVKHSEHLIVAGAGKDAVPVADLAAKVGFSVTVLDSREDFNNSRLFPLASHLKKSPEEIDPNDVTDSWWVIMNHNQALDEKTLQLALKSDPRYIGVLGPISRTEEMLINIGQNFSSGPIRSPLGLDIGAETMEEVSLSIVSELMTVRNGRNPRPLHGKVKIHA
ncbi:XdhC/CoxI family protein [Bacillus salipaludis]|uniref:XdhC family protein n=1 Tax=Bacillus salipaludis TaxID=2547811 RepID=A0A4R5VKK7_9BACI|nr:XdhC/CoxI family protein [Bacillus salipaludis]MDQ6596596.1 XdhC family protein [Bacillus salipaludis]TDK58490.1 XdhC/CoxI family protein [Bacillus salipaludis]